MGAETAKIIRTRESGWGKQLQEKRQRKVWCGVCSVVVNVRGLALAGQGAWRVVKAAGRGEARLAPSSTGIYAGPTYFWQGPEVCVVGPTIRAR